MSKFIHTALLLCALSSAYTAYAEVIPFNSALTYEVPGQAEFSLATSYRADVGDPKAMAGVVLAGPKKAKIQRDCPDPVQLYYGDNELIAEVYAKTDEEDPGSRIVDISINLFDDGLIDFSTGRTSWLFIFDSNVSEKFQRAGHYRLVLPEGLFTVNDNPVGAGVIDYDYQGDIELHYPFTITPEPGSVYDIKSPIKNVTITIDGFIRMLDYAGTPGTLIGPDGYSIAFESRYANVEGNTLTWRFKESWRNPVKWVPGEYTFYLQKNTINVNSWAGEGVPANFPEEDIRVSYILEDESTDVAAIDRETSEIYTIYTIDGKCVAKDAPEAILSTLTPGLYIINGKKQIL